MVVNKINPHIWLDTNVEIHVLHAQCLSKTTETNWVDNRQPDSTIESWNGGVKFTQKTQHLSQFYLKEFQWSLEIVASASSWVAWTRHQCSRFFQLILKYLLETSEKAEKFFACFKRTDSMTSNRVLNKLWGLGTRMITNKMKYSEILIKSPLWVNKILSLQCLSHCVYFLSAVA